MSLDIAKLRAETPGSACVLHLNAAGSALPSRRTLDATLDHLRLEAEIGGYEAADRARETLDGFYPSVARLIGAEPGEIAFIECNPRFWYHMEVAMLAGLNFVTLGCRLREGESGPPDSDTLKIRSPRRLCGNLLTPWRLNRAERAYLRYIVRDPAISGWAAFQSAIGRYRLAGGQLL